MRNHGSNMTAMGTAKSGYIQRKIVKVCEDIQIQYDQTVRDATGKIYQFCYGENGYDATKTIRVENTPVSCDISRLIDRLNTSCELGIEDEDIVPSAIPEPLVTAQILQQPSRTVSADEKKQKLIGKIRKSVPYTTADETWSVDELAQRVQSMDIEDDEEDVEIDEPEDEEKEDDEKEDDGEKEDEEIVESEEDYNDDEDDQGVDFEPDFDDE